MKQKTLSSSPKTFFPGLNIRQLAVLRFYLDQACNNPIVIADQIYTIANKLGLSYRTVNRAFRELVAMGALIIVKKQFNGSNWVKIANQFYDEHWQREMYNWFSRFPILLVTLSMLFSTNPALCGELRFKSNTGQNKREISEGLDISMSNKATLIQGICESLRRRGFEVSEEERCRLETYSYPMLQDACNLMKSSKDVDNDKQFFFELLRKLVAADIKSQQLQDAAHSSVYRDIHKGEAWGPFVSSGSDVSNEEWDMAMKDWATVAPLVEESGVFSYGVAPLSHEDKEISYCLESIRALEELMKDPECFTFAQYSLKVVKARYERLVPSRRGTSMETVAADSKEAVREIEDEWTQLELHGTGDE